MARQLRPAEAVAALVGAIFAVPLEDAIAPEQPRGRPRKVAVDPKVARRRAQYRNAKARRRGRPLEDVPDALDGRKGPTAAIVRHVVTGEWVAVSLRGRR